MTGDSVKKRETEGFRHGSSNRGDFSPREFTITIGVLSYPVSIRTIVVHVWTTKFGSALE